MVRRNPASCFLLALILGLWSLAGWAWPDKAVKIVVPYAPGGATDAVARLLALKLADKTGQSVTVENISGAGTVVGCLAVLRAEADGHTLLFAGTGTMVVMKHTNKALPFDPETALEPVTFINTLPHWMVVKADSPYKDMAGFVQHIRNNPGKISISVNQVGGAAHLSLLQWAKENRLDFAVVPYRGSSAAIVDLIGGRIDAHVDVVGSTVPHVTSGKLKAIAVLQAEPLKEYPNVATSETHEGAPLLVRSDHILGVKAGTPPETTRAISEQVKSVMGDAAMSSLLKNFAFEPMLTTPAQARAILLKESAKYGEAVRSSGITF